jgi:acyl-CoA thioesterase
MTLDVLYQCIDQAECIDIPLGWSQGRTIYGGLVAGMLMHKALGVIQDQAKHLLSCYVTFVGPVQQGQVKLTAEILRQGKSVTTVEVRLWQNHAVQTCLIASFGTDRPSDILVQRDMLAPDYAAVSSLQMAQHHPLAPECFQQMDLVWAEGQYPCSGSTQPDFGGYFRFKPALHDQRAMNIADLMVAFDMWPPGVLAMFNGMAPASSLTWQLTYINPLQSNLQDWFKYKVITDHAANGYSTEQAYLWDQQNRLIAVARQTVTVFA